MDITIYFNSIVDAIAPILILSGFVSLFINIVIMLIDILINAFTGRGFKL